jgi:hypothetical protein
MTTYLIYKVHNTRLYFMILFPLERTPKKISIQLYPYSKTRKKKKKKKKRVSDNKNGIQV